MSERVIYVVRSWPRLSQTFILNEVLALERRGLALAIFPLVRSGEDIAHPEVEDVRAPVHYLEDDLGQPWRQRARAHLALLRVAPLRYASTLMLSLTHPRLAAGYGECSTLRCFSLAVALVSGIDRIRAAGDSVVHVHAHFAHDPALVGMLAARMSGRSFTFTGHARDLLQIPVRSLRARAAHARAVIACCRANADYIDTALPHGSAPPVSVVHHGVDLDRFRPGPVGRTSSTPVVLSVGRLVEKKGFGDLLRALSAVAAGGAEFRCRIIGDGPLRDELTGTVEDLDLGDVVELVGARSNDDVVTALRCSDVFALTPLVAADGDRDGIPNVLVEAMASGLPVVTTSVGGIPELVQHDVNGLVCAPGDIAALAASVGLLLNDPPTRSRLGQAGRRTVEEGYDVDVAARQLERILLPRVGTRAEAVP
jgi:glycosyltransferase involved in cell wall biosynthesis